MPNNRRLLFLRIDDAYEFIALFGSLYKLSEMISFDFLDNQIEASAMDPINISLIHIEIIPKSHQHYDIRRVLHLIFSAIDIHSAFHDCSKTIEFVIESINPNTMIIRDIDKRRIWRIQAKDINLDNIQPNILPITASIEFLNGSMFYSAFEPLKQILNKSNDRIDFQVTDQKTWVCRCGEENEIRLELELGDASNESEEIKIGVTKNRFLQLLEIISHVKGACDMQILSKSSSGFLLALNGTSKSGIFIIKAYLAPLIN